MTKTIGLIDLVPSEFYLSQNYPKPFSDKTSIQLCVACKTRVKLEVYDSEGVNVNTLLDEEKEAGTYAFEFSARGGSPPANEGQKGRAGAFGGDTSGLASGVYFYRLTAGDFVHARKLLLL